jgi:hypothetical protein
VPAVYIGAHYVGAIALKVKNVWGRLQIFAPTKTSPSYSAGDNARNSFVVCARAHSEVAHPTACRTMLEFIEKLDRQ